MRPVESAGADKRGVQIRKDLPRHDHTGGNYWFADMTKYQDVQGTLRLGGDLSSDQLTALDLGQQRAVEHLQQAASLQVSGNTLKVVNLTGHKLISGYPEGRRMWLNIRWYDTDGVLIEEDGAYGNIGATIANPSGGTAQVESIVDPASTRVYEAHYAITREWAQTLMAVNSTYYGPIVLNYDRLTGADGPTIADLAAGNAGDHQETFHFVLNNHVSSDNRIPPYGMSYDTAQQRNALPVPANQYGGGTSGSIYNYWDEIDFSTSLKPAGAVYAEIDLLYQGTSWEYIQFLDKANNGQNAFLGQEGVNMLDAWINAEVPVAMAVNGDRKMVPPVLMASTTWGIPPTGNIPPDAVNDSYSTPQDSVLSIAAPGVLANDFDQNSDPLTAVLVPNGTTGNVSLADDGSFVYTPAPGFTGDDHFTYQANDGQALSNLATVLISVTPTGGGATAGVSSLETGLVSGKGQNQTFTPSSLFSPGDTVTIRMTVLDGDGNPVPDATVTVGISGPESTTVTSNPSDADGLAEASWKTSNKGKNPTPTGTYSVSVTGVTATGYTWDQVQTSTTITLQ
jgi:hypothetical protein